MQDGGSRRRLDWAGIDCRHPLPHEEACASSRRLSAGGGALMRLAALRSSPATLTTRGRAADALRRVLASFDGGLYCASPLTSQSQARIVGDRPILELTHRCKGDFYGCP